MSSQNPPNPFFSGIQYNPDFFQSSSYITINYANANYYKNSLPITPTANPTSLTQIGGTSIVNGSTIMTVAGRTAGIYTASVTLQPGSYLLVGIVQYTLALAISCSLLTYGCGFNTTAFTINSTTGTPYYASSNYYNSNTNGPTFTAIGSGFNCQCVMNINLTVATTIYLNYFSYFSTGSSQLNSYSQINITRLG